MKSLLKKCTVLATSAAMLFSTFVPAVSALSLVPPADLTLTDMYLNHTNHVNMVFANIGGEDVTRLDGKVRMYINGSFDREYDWHRLAHHEWLDAGESSKFNPYQVGSSPLSGSAYYDVQVCLDTTNVVVEANENNNCLTKRFVDPNYTSVPTAQLPNFSLDHIGVEGPNNILVVEQRGGHPNPLPLSTVGHTYIYIDDMVNPTWTYSWQTLDDRDFLLGNGNHSAIRPQALSPGRHTVKACVDALNEVEETHEWNNCKTVTLDVKNSSTSTPTSTSISTTTQQNKMYTGFLSAEGNDGGFESGDRVHFIVDGREFAPGVDIRNSNITLSPSRGWALNTDNYEHYYGEKRNKKVPVRNLVTQHRDGLWHIYFDAPVVTSRQTFQFTVEPRCTSSSSACGQSYYLQLANPTYTDPYCENHPQKCGNFFYKTGQMGIHYTVSPKIGGKLINTTNGSLPDLVIEDIYKTSHEASGQVYLTFDMMNQGSADATAANGNTYIYVDGKRVFTYSNWSTHDTDFLQVGGVSSISPIGFYGTSPLSTLGDHIVKVCVDNSNVVAESNERNNCMQKTLTTTEHDRRFSHSNTTSTPQSTPGAGYEGPVVVSSSQVDNPFSDTDMDDLEGIAAATLYDNAILGGYPDGTFKGDRGVNRAEAAKFLLLARYESIEDIENNGYFRDVKNGEWYTKYVVTAAGLGIINGYSDGTFRPADTVNTAEFLKMMALTFDLELDRSHGYADVPADAWFSQYAGIADRYDLFPNRYNTRLLPGKEMTRKEVAIAIYQYLANR